MSTVAENEARAQREALEGVDEIVTVLASAGHGDYSAHREDMAYALYHMGHWSGNWDAIFDPGDGLPAIRLIEENEYDQSMDEDEDRPDESEIISQVAGGYLFLA